MRSTEEYRAGSGMFGYARKRGSLLIYSCKQCLQDFTILVGINKIIQNLPTTQYHIKSRLVEVITKYKNVPWFSTSEWEKFTKLGKNFKQNIVIEEVSSTSQAIHLVQSM